MQRETGDSGGMNASSLIDLKAELFRKQEEFKHQKLQSQNAGYVKGKPSVSTNKKPNIFSKKNAGVARRSEKDYEEKVEEEDVFARSKQALENKARLYEKITTGSEIPEEDGSDFYLVDFQKKVIDDVIERRDKERQEKEERERREAEEDRRVLEEPVPHPANEEEEWVDYVDSLGRSRRCLKKDLPDLRQADRKLQTAKGVQKEESPSLLSGDMRREINRQKWEKEEIEKMEKEKEGPVHYADVQHNEIRTHGVGFYQFDKEETIRQEQMDQLKKLRDETKDERSKRERIKEKRKAALAARLAKVKQRKREKLGLPDAEEDENVSSGEEIGPQPLEQAHVPSKLEPEPLIRDDSWRKTTDLTREWDKGKEKITERSEKSWLERQRAEREEEFAPPSFYYEESKPHPQSLQTNQKPLPKRPFHRQEYETKERDNDSDAIAETENLEGVDRGSQIVADVILKRLREFRGDDGETASASADSVEVNNSGSQCQPGAKFATGAQYDQTQLYAQGSTSGHCPVDSYSVPSPPLNMPLQANQGMPYPMLQVPDIPPTNTAEPPPPFSVPPPDFSIPPPGINVPPPNFNIPPPNINCPPPGFPVQNQGQPFPVFQDVQVDAKMLSASLQPAPSKPKRIISKLDIIDTRLMENEDDT